MKKLLLIQLVLTSFFLLMPFAALAEDTQKGVLLDPNLKPLYATDIQVQGDQNRASLANAVLQMIAGGLIWLAGPIAVLMLAAGGVRYITSRGDQTQLEEAKKTITWSIIGLVAIILSWAIITNVMWIALHGGEIGTEKTPEYTTAPAQTGTGGSTPSGGETAPSTPPAESTPSE